MDCKPRNLNLSSAEISRRALFPIIGGALISASSMGSGPSAGPSVSDAAKYDLVMVQNALASAAEAFDLAVYLSLREPLSVVLKTSQKLGFDMARVTDSLKSLRKEVAAQPNSGAEVGRLIETSKKSLDEVSRVLSTTNDFLKQVLLGDFSKAKVADELAKALDSLSTAQSLFRQVRESVLGLRYALEKVGITGEAYQVFIGGKFSMWDDLGAFEGDLITAKKAFAESVEAAAAGRKGLNSVLAAARAATELSAVVGGGMEPIEVELAAVVGKLGAMKAIAAEQDKPSIEGISDMMQSIIKAVDRPKPAGGLMAGVDPAFDLWSRARDVLVEATARTVSNGQVDFVVLVAAGTFWLPSPAAKVNAVSAAIMILWPRINYKPRTTDKAKLLATAILA